MVLGYAELKSYADENITCLNDDNIRGSSIDLSLSEEAKIINNKKDISFFDLDINKHLSDIYETINLTKGYILKPQSFIYTTTNERINIPNDKCGIILPRSTFARIGLILPMSFYANPGYNGHLPIIIYNASPCNITLAPYIRIAQLLILEVKGQTIPYDDFKDTKYYNENKLAEPHFNDIEMEKILAKLQ